MTSDGTSRKEKFLPYIRPKNRRNDFKKPSPVKKTKSEAEQRLSSAQNEKLNELRSRISDVRRQLEQERFENQTLRIVQKREEKSLKTHEDQEYSAQKVTHDYKNEIEYVKEKINYEREAKVNLEKEVQDQDETLRDQTKRMKFYEKLVTHEQDYEEYDKLRQRLKETDKRLKEFQEKITKQVNFHINYFCIYFSFSFF
jgi:chromosome segregation ATPase